MSERVLISNLNPGEVRLEFMRSLFSMMMYDINNNGNIHSFVPRHAGPCLGIYRNMAVDHMLATEADWIFFVDSDIEFKDDTLDRLLEVADPMERPVVSGLYMMNLDEGIRPSIFHRTTTVDDDGVEQIRMVADVDFPDDELVQADGCGAGCLLIHRGILEAMAATYGKPRPWFGEDIFDDVIYGEDFFFCMRVMQMGYKVYVHTGIDVGHIKTVCINKQMAQKLDVVVPEEKK